MNILRARCAYDKASFDSYFKLDKDGIDMNDSQQQPLAYGHLIHMMCILMCALLTQMSDDDHHHHDDGGDSTVLFNFIPCHLITYIKNHSLQQRIDPNNQSGFVLLLVT